MSKKSDELLEATAQALRKIATNADATFMGACASCYMSAGEQGREIDRAKAKQQAAWDLLHRFETFRSQFGAFN